MIKSQKTQEAGMRRIITLFILISILALLCACGDEKAAEREPMQFGELGSAGELRGTTVVVSVFADDNQNRWIWDKNDAIDNRIAYTMLKYTGIACDWLTSRAARYGAEAEFIYDWSEDHELYCGVVLPLKLTDCMTKDLYSPICQVLENKVDSRHLMEKYNADNIVYFIISNTPYENGVRPCSMTQDNGNELPYGYEFAYIFAREDGMLISPGVFVHELLHLFGAPDLYYENERYGISREYVEHLTEVNSNDIMFRVSAYGEKIINDLTETDAYFVGLTDSAEDVEEWGIHR